MQAAALEATDRVRKLGKVVIAATGTWILWSAGDEEHERKQFSSLCKCFAVFRSKPRSKTPSATSFKPTFMFVPVRNERSQASLPTPFQEGTCHKCSEFCGAGCVIE